MNDGNKNNNRNNGVDNDYLDLLTSFNDRKENNHANTSSRDIYSDSSKTDSTRSYRENDDVYIGRRQPERKPQESSANRRRYDESSVIDIDREVKNTEYRDVYSDSSKRPTNRPQQPRRNPDEVSDYEKRHGKPPKKRKGMRIFLAVIALVLVFTVGFGVWGVSSVLGVVDKFIHAEEIQHIEDVDSLKTDSAVTNVLLIGLDKATGGSSRSDSIMIVSVNKENGKITVTSILRDTHLYVPGERESKINAAYSWGGANLLIQTIELNFGIKIDEYATVDFNMFTDLIDGIGGVDVEVTEKEADWLNNSQNYHKSKKPDTFESGESVHLSGYQALWYSRIRYLDSDFMRTKRQRKVIAAIANNIKGKLTPAGIPKLIDTAQNVAPYIETTLTKSDLMNLCTAALTCLSKSGGDINNMLVSQKIPFEGTWSYDYAWDGSIVSIDLEQNKEMLHQSIFEGETFDEETT